MSLEQSNRNKTGNSSGGSNNSSSSTSNAPPLPTRKNRNTIGYSQTPDVDPENLQVTQFYLRDLPEIAKKFQTIILTYQEKNQTLENEKNDLKIRQNELSSANTNLEKQIEEIGQRNENEKRRLIKKRNDADLEIQELKKNIRIVSEEASRYQSALGNATNVRWDDDDVNNTVQLSKWITGIQNTLNDFANIKGRDVEINEEHRKNANMVLEAYGCVTRLSDSGGGNVKTGKPVLSAALQRMVLETLFNEIDVYLKKNSQGNKVVAAENRGELTTASTTTNDDSLEAEIANMLGNLTDLLDELVKTRQGEDDTSRITPVKIRQQVYAALGTRGFCKPEHPFIKRLIGIVLNLMLEYRRFKSDEKIQDSKTIAEELVLLIVHLYFRLNAQVPVPDFRLFFESGAPIQTTYMEGSWDDNSINELVVEICSFPLIYVNNKENRKVLTKAQVLTRRK